MAAENVTDTTLRRSRSQWGVQTFTGVDTRAATETLTKLKRSTAGTQTGDEWTEKKTHSIRKEKAFIKKNK